MATLLRWSVVPIGDFTEVIRSKSPIDRFKSPIGHFPEPIVLSGPFVTWADHFSEVANW